jgi:hypothetical protein
MQQQDNILKYAQSATQTMNRVMKEVYKCDPVCTDQCSSDVTRLDINLCNRCQCETPFKVTRGNVYKAAHGLKYKDLVALSKLSVQDDTLILADEAKPEDKPAEAGKDAGKDAPKDGEKPAEEAKGGFNMLYVAVPLVLAAVGGLAYKFLGKKDDENEGGANEDLYVKIMDA